MNSSMACAYDSCELAAASELRTAFFDCSKSGSRSIVLGLGRLVVFFQRAILAASCAAFSMVIHFEGQRLERCFSGAMRRRTIWFTQQGVGCIRMVIQAVKMSRVSPARHSSRSLCMEASMNKHALGRRHFLKTLTAIGTASLPIAVVFGSRLGCCGDGGVAAADKPG